MTMTDDPDYEDNIRLMEAVVFASDKPLRIADIARWFPVMGESAIAAMLGDIQNRYRGRGIVLNNTGGEWFFATAADLGARLDIEIPAERRLSRAAMETLAVIAYHQPLTRAEIENIRGVATGKGTLDILMESGWVKPGRRRETPGRPLTWVTTTHFLAHFGLESMTDLPGLDDLKAAGLLDRRPAARQVPVSGELFDADEEEAHNDA